jgi:hypothetical protein
VKRDAARARASQRFEGQVGKALARATRRGVAYTGPGAPDIAQTMDFLAIGAVMASAGIVPDEPAAP